MVAVSFVNSKVSWRDLLSLDQLGWVGSRQAWVSQTLSYPGLQITCWSRDEAEVGVSEWQAGVGMVNKYYLLYPAWMSSRKKGRKELDVDD